MEMREEWSDCFADRDAYDWEQYLGGPSDEEIEQQYRQQFEAAALEDGDHDDHWWGEHGHSDRSDPLTEPVAQPQQAMAQTTQYSRQAQIVTWLSTSVISRALRTGQGFYVERGMSVQLEDGNIYDALDWLFDEGISEGTRLAGYRVCYTPPGGPWREKLTFFLDCAIAPFLPRGCQVAEVEMDSDVPF